MQSPDQQLQTADQNLGVSAAQQQVTGLQTAINNTQNLLNNVAPSVMGNTGQSLVTDAQANQQIQNQQAPLSQQLTGEQQSFDTDNANYQNLQGQAESEANANQTAQQNQLGYLQNIYNTLYSGEQSQAQLTQNQNQFTQQEAQQAQQSSAQLAESAREANMEYGSTTSPTLADSLTGETNGNLQGIGYKNGSTAQNGFDFTSGNTPVSAASWATQNGVSLSNLLYSMAQAGDSGASKAYKTIAANKGQVTDAIKSEYSDIFWGS